MTAPTCLVQPDIKIEQPDPRTWPSVPNAYDLPSALAAINALRQMMAILLNQLSRNNRVAPPPPGGHTSSSRAQKTGKYTEVHRTMQTVRVFNPQDKTQFVDVQQVSSLTMQDNKTAEQWTWTL